MNRAERRAEWVARTRLAARQHTPEQGRETRTAQEPHSTERNGVPFVAGVASAPGVRLHIAELVLYGFAAGDRHAIGAAMQQELTRLLSQEGVPSRLARRGAIESLNTGSFAMAANARPRTVGAQAAQAVYGGVRR